MAKQVAVSSAAIVVVCNLILVASLADWAHSAPSPNEYNSPQLVAPVLQPNFGPTGHLQRRSPSVGQLPAPTEQLAPVQPSPLADLSQSDRFKRQSVAGNASSVGANPNKKKNKKKKNNKKDKNKKLLAECLEAHNKFRRQHRVPDLEWDDKIAEFAQKRSNHIAASDGAAFGHPPDLPFGENLFWHSSIETACEHMVRGWYDEINLYNYKSPTFAPETGHFTQMIWRQTSKVGCAFATSSGKRGGIYLTCNYDPPGNFIGEFNDNVPLPVAAESTNNRVPPTQVVAKPAPVPASSTTTTTTTTSTERSVTTAAVTAPSTTTTTTTTTAVVPAVVDGADYKPTDTPTTKPKKKNKKKKKKKDKNKKKDKKKNKNKKKKPTTTTTTTTTSTTTAPLPVQPAASVSAGS